MSEPVGRKYDIPYDDRWNTRVEQMYALLPHDNTPIIDFGAGECHLRQLAKDRPYHPVDQQPLAPDVLAVDLDDWAHGGVDLVDAKIAFCSGVLEYLNDLEAFVRRVSTSFDLFVFSFNVFCGDHVVETEVRKKRLWKNHHTTGQLITLCEQFGLRVEVVKKSKPHSTNFEYIFLAVSRTARSQWLEAIQSQPRD